MTEAIICDRCNAAVNKRYYKHNGRSEIRIAQTSTSATAYNPSNYELCESCTDALQTFLSETDKELGL